MNALMLAFFAVVAIAAAAPPAAEKPHAEPIAIIAQESEVNPDGSYVSKFETENGISQSEQGSSKTDGKEEIQVAQGYSSYTSPEGVQVKTEWYADETGFHAKGDHLPKGPDTPPEIARALEWAEAHPWVPEDDEVEAEKIAKKITPFADEIK